MAVIVNGDGILTGISSLATALTDLTSGRGTVTGVATVGTLQLGAGVSMSSPRSQNAAIFTNNSEFLTVDDAGRVGVGTISPNTDAHPQNVGKINVGFITARSIAGDIDANTMVVAGISTFVGALNASTGTFSGDVSIADKIIHTGDTNTSIRFSGADTIKLETAGTERFQVDSSGNIYVGGVGGSATAGTLWFNDTSANASKIAQSNGNSALTFHTGSSQPERARIDSSGRLLIGTTVTTDAPANDAGDIIIGTTSDTQKGITIVGSTSGGINNIFFSDGAGYNNQGRIAYYHADDSMRFTTNVAERLRIDTNGRVAIGLASPSTPLHVYHATTNGVATFESGDATALINFKDNSSSAPPAIGTVGDDFKIFTSDVNRATIKSTGNFGVGTDNPGLPFHVYHATSNGILKVQSGDSNAGITIADNGGEVSVRAIGDALTLNTSSAETERVRIHDSLYVTLGTTSTYPRNGGISVEGGVGHVVLSRANTNGEVMIRFERDNATRGNITVSTSTTYNTTSDYRLKENITNLSDAITRIKKITPRRFNFIDDENNQLVDGFIAHEVSEAVPEAVSGTKDQVATADDVTANNATTVGEPIHQQVDYSKYVPLLTAALQEAITKIETLETKVAALEGG